MPELENKGRDLSLAVLHPGREGGREGCRGKEPSADGMGKIEMQTCQKEERMFPKTENAY